MRLSYSGLPKVLIIDDQFGRCGLGKSFQKSVGPDLFQAYQADRENLCRIYGILDGSGDTQALPVESCQIAGVFSPGQRWDPETKQINNDLDAVRAAISRGWPFNDGSRWALVLLDLRFVSGEINEFGDPTIGSMFGADTILPMIRKEFSDDLPVIILSSTPKDQHNASVRTSGALDFIQRLPGAGASVDNGHAALKKAIHAHGLLEDSTGTVVGRSLATLKMLRQARRGAIAARNILLLGETGTGKGLLANYIHLMSMRADHPFESFHAAHRPADLQADELFGHWKGAFTGATGDIPGIWERANGGTVFIDEVADIDLRVQQMLMQPIEERKVRRVGSPAGKTSEPTPIDTLVVLATNRDLESAAKSGEFKDDFLNRINAFTITIPPLRERPEDIPLLVAHLTSRIAPNWKGKFLPNAMDALVRREWRKGNIRELRNVIERALANNPDQDITASDVDEFSGLTFPVVSQQKSTPESSPSSNISDIATRDVLKLSLTEIEEIKRRYAGTFPEMLANILVFALRLTQSNGKLNPTAASRFLLGNPHLNTVQAKQFIHRVLNIDTADKRVVSAFKKSGLSDQHKLLQTVTANLRQRTPKATKAKRSESPVSIS